MTDSLNPLDDALIAEVRWAEQDYRRIFPEPNLLAPNLSLAVQLASIVETRNAQIVELQTQLDALTKSAEKRETTDRDRHRTQGYKSH